MGKRNKKEFKIYIQKAKKNIKKFDRKLNILVALVFIGFIIIICTFSILKKDKEFSEQENRNLAKNPTFTWKSYFSGDYTKEYTDYISDQFPGRSRFISIKGRIDNLLGKNEINGVYIGEEGQLIEKYKENDKTETNVKVKAINEFLENHKSLNTSFMLIPTAGSILEDKLPKYAPIDDQLAYIKSIESLLNSDIKFINPYNDLYNNKDKYIYYKTDHHWTSEGAYIGYRTMCKELGLTPKEKEDFNIEKVSDSFYGSLSSKIGSMNVPSDEIEIYSLKDDKVVVNYVVEQKKVPSLFSSEALDKKDKYEVFTAGNHPLINIETLGDPEKNLLIIKDSFANSFIPLLTSHYGEINVVDLRYYSDDLEKLIEDREITDVIFLYNVNTFNEDDSILNINS